MNKLILIILGSLIIAIPACVNKEHRAPSPCTKHYNQQLEDEVEIQFNNLLSLAENQNFINFQTYISDSSSAMTEGYWVPQDSITSYIFKVFKNLAHDSVEINKKEYDVVCCHSTSVYQRVLAYYSPIDTARGCPAPMSIPMSLRIGTEPASKYNDYDKGIETMQIRPIDTAGNNVRMFSLGDRIIPIKTMAVSIVWDKDMGIWKAKHIHVSLGLKRTEVYEIEEWK